MDISVGTLCNVVRRTRKVMRKDGTQVKGMALIREHINLVAFSSLNSVMGFSFLWLIIA